MVGLSRYNVSAQQAGLDGSVLKNKLGITNPDELMDAETLLLNDAYEHFAQLVAKNKLVLRANAIFDIHEYIFGTLYDWAGKIRTVDISKEGMLFAPIAYIHESIEFMKNSIDEHLPEETDDISVVAEKLAVIHNEFNAVHPFREGNGRTIRLFIDLLLILIGRKTLDYSNIESKYIDACIAGMAKDHKPMQKIFEDLLT